MTGSLQVVESGRLFYDRHVVPADFTRFLSVLPDEKC